MKSNTVIGSNQHGLMKEKSRQTNLMAFYEEMTSLVDEHTICAVCFGFKKVFDVVSRNTLVDTWCGIDWRTVRWTESWLNFWSQSIVISNTKSI